MARASYMDTFRGGPFERNWTRGLGNNRWMGRNNNYWGRNNNPFSFTAFGTGLLVGVGMALLLAPKSGRELRDDLTRRAGTIGENVRNRFPQMTDRENTDDREVGSTRRKGQPNANPAS